MAKDIVPSNEMIPETGAVNGGAGSDFGGDLADNKGVDLNADVQKERKKTGLGQRIGAGALLPVAVLSGGGDDDGRFNPNAQIEAEELDNALRGPGYAEYTDAPPPYEFNLPEGYTSNIGELKESENAANAVAENEQAERWQQYAEAAAQYEAEQTENDTRQTEYPPDPPVDVTEPPITDIQSDYNIEEKSE